MGSRRARVLLCAVILALTVVPATARADPPNANRTSPFTIFSPDSLEQGLRVVAEDQTGTPIDGVPIPAAGNTTDAGNPPITAPGGAIPPASNCGQPSQAPFFGSRTLWYQIVAPNTSHAPAGWSGDAAVVNVDAFGSTYPVVLVVYANQIPTSPDPANPTFPTNVVACQQASTIQPNAAQPFVSFVAHPGTAYYLEVTSLSPDATPDATLTLNLRVLDTQPPSVGLSVEGRNDGLLPQPGATTYFDVVGDDHGSGINPQTGYAWSVTFDGRPMPVGTCTSPGSGHACLVPQLPTSPDLNRHLIVHWPHLQGVGSVRLIVSDQVGNMAPLGYTLFVVARGPQFVRLFPPQLVGRHRIRLTSTCSRPSTLRIFLASNGRILRGRTFPATRARQRRSWTVRLGRGIFVAFASCATTTLNGAVINSYSIEVPFQVF